MTVPGAMAKKDDLTTRKAAKEEHLSLVLTTLEKVVPEYERAVKTLEKHMRNNMTPEAVVQWFRLYLRVVDLAVEIRRGEIRHRSDKDFPYKSQTKTCHANAKTNGTIVITIWGVVFDRSSEMIRASPSSMSTIIVHGYVIYRVCGKGT
jgi:hypothetical protein